MTVGVFLKSVFPLGGFNIQVKGIIPAPVTEPFNFSKIESELEKSSTAETEYFMTGVVSVPVQSFVMSVKRIGERTYTYIQP